MGVPTWSWCRSAPQSCWRLAQGLPRARPAHGRARAFTRFKGVFALANYPQGLIKRQQLLFSALFAGCTGGRSLGGALRSSQSPCLQDAALWMHLSPISHLMPPALSPGLHGCHWGSGQGKLLWNQLWVEGYVCRKWLHGFMGGLIFPIMK